MRRGDHRVVELLHESALIWSRVVPERLRLFDQDLPKNADLGELACYVMTVLHGMAVQGADGAGRDQLRRVAKIALRAWPKR